MVTHLIKLPIIIIIVDHNNKNKLHLNTCKKEHYQYNKMLTIYLDLINTTNIFNMNIF